MLRVRWSQIVEFDIFRNQWEPKSWLGLSPLSVQCGFGPWKRPSLVPEKPAMWWAECNVCPSTKYILHFIHLFDLVYTSLRANSIRISCSLNNECNLELVMLIKLSRIWIWVSCKGPMSSSMMARGLPLQVSSSESSENGRFTSYHTAQSSIF